MHVPSVDYRRKLAVMLNIHYYYNRFFACYTLNYVLPLLLTGLHKAQPCRYCFYSVIQKWVFLFHRGDMLPR